jgi:hypothetical protein
MTIDKLALATDSQDWRGTEGAKEYSQILGWVLSMLQKGEELNLDKLYSTRMPEEWGGEYPADIPLYRAFLHLTLSKAAEGQGTPYMRDENGEALTSTHLEMSLRPGPRCRSTQWIVKLHQSAPDKCLIAIPNRQETPQRAALEVLEDLKRNRGVAIQAYRGPHVSAQHHLMVLEVATGRETRFDVVEMEKELLKRDRSLEM